MVLRKAECTCGACELEARGEPQRVSMCHCHACQRRTGSLFGAQAWFPSGDVNLKGITQCFERTADSGNRIQFYFCPTCSDTVYYRGEAFPDWTAVPVGLFADSHFPRPMVSVYEARKHDWIHVPVDMKHMD